MATKIIRNKRSFCSPQQSSQGRGTYHTYGKPTKPRCEEPSMYEILSWKDKQNQVKTGQIPQFQQGIQNESSLQALNKKLLHSKSLPAQQFLRSKPVISIQAQNNNRTQHENIANLSQKNVTNSTKYMQSTSQMQNENSRKEFIRSQSPNQEENKKNQEKNIPVKQKHNKLKKKTIPLYTYTDKKPRYMQQKKTAIQKLIDSPDFDQDEFQKMKQDQIKKFKQTTRDLSNTAFLTYFNKPPFQNYGRQNKTSIGVLYGDYMYSHNIFPHTGDNKPKKQQTYITALSRAKSAGNIRPHPPMTRHLEDKLISSYLTLTQIYPKSTPIESIPIKNQTVLQNLPNSNVTKSSDDNYPKYSQYLKPNQNEELFTVKDQYLSRQEVPRYFSNKDQLEGKEITYNSKIQPNRRVGIQ